MQQAEKSNDDARRDVGIDGLRGIAALSVLVFHVWLFNDSHTTTRRDGALDYVFVELKLGLYLFFALSGFLLLRPYLRAAIAGRTPPATLPFVRNRLVRIAPAYWVSLVGSFALIASAGDQVSHHLPAASDIWTYAIFGQNFSEDTIMRLNPATWSLPVELGFYLMVPLIGLLAFAAARRFDDRRVLVAAVVTVALVMVAVGLTWNWLTIGEGAVSRLSLLGMLPYFAIGMLAALGVVLWQSRRGLDRERDSRVAAAVGLAGAAVLAAAILNYERDIYAESLHVIRDVPAAAGFGLLIAAVAITPATSLANRTLGARPLAGLGTISYGVYLWHVPILLWARSEQLLPEGTVLAAALILAVSLIVGAASWLLVESPAIAWGRSLRMPRRGEPFARVPRQQPLRAHRNRPVGQFPQRLGSTDARRIILDSRQPSPGSAKKAARLG